ncbi:MAG: hypothetical protein HY762_02800 [Planctomycetes bacterium]|nr:hypothetical protein [Planctomycetota bacterium]
MFNKKFEVKLYVPATWEVAGDMPDRWAEGLKRAAEVMNDRRQAKLPDDGTFILRMATPANEGYSPYVPSGFMSRSERSAEGIRGTHAANINQSFNRWNDNLNRAFATVDGVVAKEFKAKVDAAKDRWAIRIADKALRFTGDRIRGRSVAPIASFYLVGDKRASGWIREADTADGAPYNIARDWERTAVKAAIQQKIIQGGVMITNQGYKTAAMDAENAVNTTLLNGLRDTAKCDAFVTTPASDKCFCVWALDGSGLLYLHIQVGLTV